jgi:hypothetical protein
MVMIMMDDLPMKPLYHKHYTFTNLMQPALNSIWTKKVCFVTPKAENRDSSPVYALPERVKRNPVVNRSRAGQISIRTYDISMVCRILQCRSLPYTKARIGSD